MSADRRQTSRAPRFGRRPSAEAAERLEGEALARLAASACRILDADAAWIAAREELELRVVAVHPERGDATALDVARALSDGHDHAIEDVVRGLAVAPACVGDDPVGALAVRNANGGRPLAASHLKTLEELAAVAGPLLRQRARPDPAEAAVAGLAAAVELHDLYTAGHGEEVLALACRVGSQLGMAPGELRDLAFAARLHDVGKLAVEDAVLHKPGPLGPAEWSAMCTHPVTGAATLATIPGLERAADMVLTHHERWDGHGYPDGIAGEDIPLGGRVLAACDAYRAMVEDRPYRKALSPDEAVTELVLESGAHFDPAVVEALRRVLA